MFHAIREALITVWKLEDRFHIVHFSVQRTHIHLLVEANDRLALAKGMQAFGISAAKHINALILDEDGKRRRGSVFPDRYHVKILKTPRQVRNCLAYVLNNWRHHGEDKGQEPQVAPRPVLERRHVRGLEGARISRWPALRAAAVVYRAAGVPAPHLVIERQLAQVWVDQRVRSARPRRRIDPARPKSISGSRTTLAIGIEGHPARHVLRHEPKRRRAAEAARESVRFGARSEDRADAATRCRRT